MQETMEYRLPDGHVFKYTIDPCVGITTRHLDGLVSEYFLHTGHLPETVFVKADMFTQYLHSMCSSMRYASPGDPSQAQGLTVVSLWLSVGNVQVQPIFDAYIPILVGTQQDYDDNNLNWIFEETVLADCEKE